MTTGPDVKQLESSLQQLGYFRGTPNDKFDYATAAAVKRWQKASGQTVTGQITFGSFLFYSGPLRIATATARVGDQVSAGTAILAASGLQKLISIDLPVANSALGIPSGPVTIELPAGKTAKGKITSVGVPVEKKDPNTGDLTVSIPVSISFNDPAASGSYQAINVVVDFPSETRKNVLSVPVDALLALDDSRFGVELVRANGTTNRVPVSIGLFAGGRVEVSGSKIRNGDSVVVPGT
jgi:peptidoglycan hydrolase-like protein with peptidoglycan-binding domain